jgi:hypothetical protein
MKLTICFSVNLTCIIFIVNVAEKQQIEEQEKNFSDNDESVEGSANSRADDSEEDAKKKNGGDKKND